MADFEELYPHDAEHVLYVKAQRDPELWHAFAIAVVVAGDPHGFLAWVMQQAEVDRATAGYVFLGVYGGRYLAGADVLGGEGVAGSDWAPIMEAICRRESFNRDEIGLAAGFEKERLACLAQIARGDVVPGRTPPHALLASPYPAERKLPYMIEDGALYPA